MNNSCENCNVYEFKFINGFFLVIYSLLTLFICGGNALTIISIWKTNVLRTVSNIYVALLAFADFIAGVTLPFQVVYEFPDGRQLLDNNKDVCMWRLAVFFISVNLSILSILVIAFDRAVYIGRPFLYNQIATYKQAALVTCLCCVIAVADGTVCLYVNRWISGEECVAENMLTEEYRIYGQIIPLVTGFVLAGSCYGYIFYIAKKQQKATRFLNQNSSVNDMKIIKVLFLVYGIFLMCWLPVVICIIIGRIYPLPQIYLDISVPIAVLNSGMNFIVYAVKNKDFRKAFKGILCCVIRNKSQVTPLNISNT